MVAKSVLMLLVLVLIVFSIRGATSSHSPHYVWHECQVQNSNLSGSAFEASLNYTLFTKLLSNASSNGFYNFTQGSGEDHVYALFYCKGDVDSQSCQECVETATKKITDFCRFFKEGIIWFEECTLRYANRTIFSIAEEKPYHPYINYTGIVNEYRHDQYKSIFDSAMDALIQEAAYGKGALEGFATKQVNLSSSEIIRGLAQCTPDIVGLGCFTCLKAALRLRDSWANTMMFLPSCHFRYDLYGTSKVADLAPSPPPHTFPGTYIALIVVLSVVFIVIAVIGGIWLWKHCSKGNIFSARVPGQIQDSPPDVEDSVRGLPKYTFSQVEKMTKGLGKQLGRGGYAVVYLGTLNTSKEVAVKVFNQNDASEQFRNEINVLARISHKNIVSLLGYCEDTKLALIYEYMEKGDLRSLMSDNAGSLSWADRLKISIDTAEGLYYLHNHSKEHIVHRDVKPANILLNGKLQAKLADFGSSKIFPKDITTLVTRVVSTHGYTAPGYFETGLLNMKADVYSFGIVLVELITGKGPSSEGDLVEWFVNLSSEGHADIFLDPKMARNLNEGSVWVATELAQKCVRKDEERRPDMSEIVTVLKKCLDMEVKKNARNCDRASTSMEMISPVYSRSISMVPEVR